MAVLLPSDRFFPPLKMTLASPLTIESRTSTSSVDAAKLVSSVMSGSTRSWWSMRTPSAVAPRFRTELLELSESDLTKVRWS